MEKSISKILTYFGKKSTDEAQNFRIEKKNDKEL